MTNSKTIAIVTGASAGLGSEYALQIDATYKVDEIWLVARREAPMQAIAQKLKNAKGIVIPLDLAQAESWRMIATKLNQENPTIKVLVNNAGLGKLGKFIDLSEAEQIGMINVNISALTALTHICLPFIKRGGAIIQVASSIAFSPAPNFAVYAATKSYVLSLSHALRYELAPKGIHVIAVCPGPVATEFFEVANQPAVAKGQAPRQIGMQNAIMAQAHDVVARSLKDWHQKKAISVYGIAIKLFTCLAPFIPNAILMRVTSRASKD